MEKTKEKCGEIAEVALSLPLREAFDYLVPAETTVCVGEVVAVELGRKELFGVVVALKSKSDVPLAKLKPLKPLEDGAEKSGKYCFAPEFIKFLGKAADYTAYPLGAVVKMAMPVPDAFKPHLRKSAAGSRVAFDEPILGASPVVLSPAQRAAAAALCSKVGESAGGKAAGNAGGKAGFSVSVLKGLTGSGKTEVYFEAIEKALSSLSSASHGKGQSRGKGQVLVLLPEIMLTCQWVERFKRRFGGAEPALWHSELTPAKRRQTWQAVADGRVRVLVGARSAVFLPFADLRLIIVDEEHDASFKQEDGVMYQGRDMAVWRAALAGVPVILSSATPSLETLVNVREGRYSLVELAERFKGAKLPPISLIDMRDEAAGGRPVKMENGKPSWLAPFLLAKMGEALARGEQSLLFLNRRGYAPLMLCGACGHRLCCPNCSAWLVEHRGLGKLLCHHCGTVLPLPSSCPKCEAKGTMVSCGAGVERVTEEVTARFPMARVVTVTSDTLGSKEKAGQFMDAVASHQVDIIVGTQILTKGHHFPLLTLIGVVDADMGLAGGDMRAAERTFQLLSQVAGRAGREDKAGAAYLQTYQPENNVLAAIAARDEKVFIAEEIAARQALRMPPFGRMVAIIVTGEDEAKALTVAREIAKKAPPRRLVAGLCVLGPAPALMAKRGGKYRFRLLVQADKGAPLSAIIKEWLTKVKIPFNIKVQIDVDPYNFM